MIVSLILGLDALVNMYYTNAISKVIRVTEQRRSVCLTVTRASEWPPRVVRRCGCGLCRRRRCRCRRSRSDVEHGVGGWRTGGVDIVERQAVGAMSAAGTRQRHVVARTCRPRRTCG